MSSGRALLSAGLALALLSNAAHAGRYRVVINFGDAKPFVIYSGDSSLAALWTGSADLVPGSGGASFPAVNAPATGAAPVLNTTTKLGIGSKTPAPPGTSKEASVLGSPPPGAPPAPAAPTQPVTTTAPPATASGPPVASTPPSQAFTDLLQNVYFVTNAADVARAWDYYQQEDQSLPLGAGAGNAVIKYALAVAPQQVGDTNVAGLSQLTGSTATVKTASGVGVRSAPWQSTIDTAGQGTTLTVLGPPDASGWVHVNYNGKDGYVSGLWLGP